jgi:thioredoxin 1
MSNVLQVNQQTFEAQVLQSGEPVVVDFYANWCPPCRALAPILDRLADQFAGEIRFVKVNSDENPELSDRFGVAGLPTLLLIRNGEVSSQIVGLREQADLANELSEWFEKVNESTR